MITLPGYRILAKIQEDANTIFCRCYREQDRKLVFVKLPKATPLTLKDIAKLKHEYRVTKEIDLKEVVKPEILVSYSSSIAIIFDEYRGESLENIIKSEIFSLKTFLKISIEIAKILEGLHRNKVIHKDIKPSNILIIPETEQVKLINFSISSLLSREYQTVSQPEFLEGTLEYMSPEQTGRMNRAIDYRTDFYSLGVTFYKLLTRQLPFQAKDSMELVYCHIAKQPVPPSELNKGIPLAVSNIVMKLLSKTAEDRYQSALGLRLDLETCLKQWQSNGTIENFPLGSQDFSGRFQIPQKLYGRETEIKALIAAFERVSRGTTEMMLVSGYSGIGKSCLVQEIHQPIAQYGGYFIFGKFEQYKRNIPYSSLIQAFQELIRQLLTENEEQIENWRTKLLNALGTNGRVIVDVIPEVELIIGPQVDVPQLGPAESQNRFNLVFKQFIHVFTTKEKPLVLFLDDLHWADSASLRLIQLLITDSDSKYLLMVGAYRDNELNNTHPLMLALKEIYKTDATVNNINLQPLKLFDINNLIADSLACPIETSQPLAELVFSKTAGNPFFLKELLNSLAQEMLLSFNFTNSSWQWDIEQIQKIGITENVVELTIGKIQKLAESTQNVLKLAACVGNQFALDILAMVSEKSLSATADDLWEALFVGLILPLDGTYKIPMVISNQQTEQLTVEYKFLHDRVQQAAYSLIPEDEKKAIHLKVGQLLLQNKNSLEREEKIFDIVNHLNIAEDLIVSQADKDELAQLNLIAGRKAKAATAYEPALRYLRAGLKLLAAGSWQLNYELTLALYVETAEAEYLNTNFESAKQLSKIVLGNARSLLEKVKVYELQIQFYMAQSQMLQAIDTGVSALEMLGVSWSNIPNDSLWVVELPRLADLENLPEMTDASKLAALQLLTNLFAPAYVAKPEIVPKIVLTMVNLCIEHGYSSLAVYAYALYGMLLCAVRGNIDAGYLSGQLALKLLDKFSANSVKSKVYNLFNGFIRPWKEHVRETIAPLLEGLQSGLEAGDIEFASHCAGIYCMHIFYLGEHLEAVSQQQAQRLEMLLKLKQEFSIYFAQIWRQVTLNLQGLAENKTLLIGSSFNELNMLQLFVTTNNHSLLFVTYLAKASLLYLFKDYTQAVTYASLAAKYEQAVAGMIVVAEHNFYYSLALLSQYLYVAPIEQELSLRKVSANQETMKCWASRAAMNYQHKYDLVEAERARISGNIIKAMELYDQAIVGARNNGYIKDEALANELAGEFYLSLKREKVAYTYITDAYYGYVGWGALAKATDLLERYPQLLSRTSTWEKVTQITPSTLTARNLRVLDLTTVFKASQALSSEIVLDKLLKKLMTVVIENAGAETGIFLIKKANQLLIEAQGTVNDISVLESIPVDLSQALPKSVINYVEKTREYVVLDNAALAGLFTNDPYIKAKQLKSILCLPVIYQEKLTGILYLENNLTSGAFTPERVKILTLLTTEISISMENAELYTNLKSYSKELKIKNTELSEVNKKLEAEVAERKQALEALQQAKEQLQAVLDTLPGFIAWVSSDGRYLGVNRHITDTLKIPPSAFIGKKIGFASSSDYVKFMYQFLAGQEQATSQIIDLSMNNSTRHYFFVAQKYNQGNAAVLVGIDITEQKLAEGALRASLREKEVLLQEVHHRVKNNLQVISSLLDLQSQNLTDQKTLEMLRQSYNRIKSMALIHEKLYQSASLERINFADYIETLIHYLLHSYTIDAKQIAVKINIENIFLNIDTAIPCGLIINELVSNALKYAFLKKTEGLIEINLNLNSEQKFILIVKDNGVGLPKNLNFQKVTTLGLQLVKILTEQLEGEIELYQNQGTEFRIQFYEIKN